MRNSIKAGILAALLPASLPAADDAAGAVPVWEEPRHRLVYEKDEVRVFSTIVPAGDRTLFHQHGHPTLYVLLAGARVRNQDAGGDWTDPPAGMVIPDGAFLFRDYGAEPQTHRVENTDDHSFQVIGVINPGAGSETPPSLSQQPEVTNRWFDGYRFRLAPGARSGTHRHAQPVLVVQLGAGRSSVIENGRAVAEKTVAGNWSMHAAGAAHELANDGAHEIELVELEIR